MPFFSLYLNICRLQKGPGKFFMGVLESPGKVVDFFVSERVGTLCFRLHPASMISKLSTIPVNDSL